MPNNLEKPTTSEIELPDDLVHVEGGTFQMGNDNGPDSEKPVHEVTVSDFYISQYPITVKQYRLFCDETHQKMPKKPSWGWRDNHPIVNISWEEAKAYCEWKNGRLPTEAEWEFAAIGGNKSIGYKYSGGDQAKKVAQYKDNTDKTYIVGKKQPNELNLFDMSGNVWEWCRDSYGSYNSEPQNNPQGPTEGNKRVLRGGSWNCGDYRLRVTVRRGIDSKNKHSDVGFRLVKSQEEVERYVDEERSKISPTPLFPNGENPSRETKKPPIEPTPTRTPPVVGENLPKTPIENKICSMREERFAELEEQWKLLNDKRARLERQKILETREEEKFRLEQLIDDIHKDCQKIEQEISELEI
jgi:sulfatase modifying factor 1